MNQITFIPRCKPPTAYLTNNDFQSLIGTKYFQTAQEFLKTVSDYPKKFQLTNESASSQFLQLLDLIQAQINASDFKEKYCSSLEKKIISIVEHDLSARSATFQTQIKNQAQSYSIDKTLNQFDCYLQSLKKSLEDELNSYIKTRFGDKVAESKILQNLVDKFVCSLDISNARQIFQFRKNEYEREEQLKEMKRRQEEEARVADERRMIELQEAQERYRIAQEQAAEKERERDRILREEQEKLQRLKACPQGHNVVISVWPLAIGPLYCSNCGAVAGQYTGDTITIG